MMRHRFSRAGTKTSRLCILSAGLFAFILLNGSAALRAEKASYEGQFGLISPGGFVVFFNSQGPFSYSTLTPRDLPLDAVDLGEVRCSICQHGVSVPLELSPSSRGPKVSGAQGDGSYRSALKALRRDHPDLKGIYDVKVDFQKISILGFYKRVCTEISARGFK